MLDFIKSIAREAGEITLTAAGNIQPDNVIYKNDKDLVTEIDKQVEMLLIRKINASFPDHSILGEETGLNSGTGDYQWIIDPIDGTTSFIHGQPFYSISIAVNKGNTPVASVVYAPKINELFSAAEGKGCFLNDSKISVSTRNRLIQSVLATGFACLRANWSQNNLTYFNEIVPNLRGVRRYGSAALDLAYVACGRLEGFWEMNLQPYDIAAGILLVKEAGGHVMDFSGSSNYPENGIIATNGLIDTELLSYFKDK